VSDTVTRENVRSVCVNNGKKVSERTIPRNAEEQRGRHKLGDWRDWRYERQRAA